MRAGEGGRVLLALDGPTVRVLKADDLAGRPLGVFGAPNLEVAAAVAIGGRATTVVVRYPGDTPTTLLLLMVTR